MPTAEPVSAGGQSHCKACALAKAACILGGYMWYKKNARRHTYAPKSQHGGALVPVLLTLALIGAIGALLYPQYVAHKARIAELSVPKLVEEKSIEFSLYEELLQAGPCEVRLLFERGRIPLSAQEAEKIGIVKQAL